ncbi:acyl-CoA dehydrogenase family protein [Dactylosporangium siamense]|uniref:Acyl-CoA dehydrogenase n=1 Tax=Dactylosporangium siamense TaxID=685454 RepID=A0A919PY52_9ACTN|nr:acyl-CoA dehydrogenase family protein [Dactylosporangium siamense]GIG52546.1 acyl-CoA dehydrogenase [Dactylosporangium siamense]
MMDFALSSEQLDLRAGLTALFADHSTPARVRAAEPLGFDPALWAVLGGFGFPHLAGSRDGAPARLADLAVAAQDAGACLASAPLVETLVATRLLDRLGAAAGDDLVTFSPRPAVAGVARTVPWAAVADRVIACDGDRILIAGPGHDVERPKQTLAGLAIGHADLTGATVLAEGPAAVSAFAEARADWQVLTAAALAGVAAAGLHLGVEYAKTRHQFGQPIGAFQALAHQLADAAALVDGAQLLVQEAAWAGDTGSPRRHGLAAMAAAFAGRAARQATDRGLHAHGGYGYTLEYDIQLYFRRAKALSLLSGGESAAVDAVVALALADTDSDSDHDTGRR